MEENWINIYEIDNFKIDTNIWLEDLLRKNNIPYKKEIEEYWDGLITPEYKLKLKVFIPLEYEETVKKYVEEYEDEDEEGNVVVSRVVRKVGNNQTQTVAPKTTKTATTKTTTKAKTTAKPKTTTRKTTAKSTEKVQDNNVEGKEE